MVKQKNLLNIFLEAKQKLSERVTVVFFLNVLLIVFQFVYLFLRYKYLNDQIPFWYTKTWGDFQLALKNRIFLIPLISLFSLTGGWVFIVLLKKYYVRYVTELISIFVTTCNLLLTLSLVRIIYKSSAVFQPIITPVYAELILPFLFSFFLVVLIVPFFIEFAKKHNIVTNPALHNHPGMILSRPSARAGGSAFVVGFLVTAFLFIPFSPQYIGIYIVALLLALIGFIDDYQNTHPKSPLRIFEIPALRLLTLFVAVSLIISFGIKIAYIGNPFGGIVDFNSLSFQLGALKIAPLSAIITVFWIVWVLNVLSWSNGIDGQYAGIVGIAAIVVALLALRFVPLEQIHSNNAKLAIILAGATFGLLPYTWHPSKIMWGFGSISAAFVLSSISILVGSKVATSIIIILIPFLDALVTAIRRILQGKNPLKGDRGHLHHILLDRGWSVKKIAVFYWISTAFFGIVALLSSEKALALVTLTSAGIVAFALITLNLKSIAKKQSQSESA